MRLTPGKGPSRLPLYNDHLHPPLLSISALNAHTASTSTPHITTTGADLTYAKT
jgi:hypothetical protein